MPQNITKSGLNRMVTTTLSDEDREAMEKVCKEPGYSYSGFVKRAIRLMLRERSNVRMPYPH